MQTIKKLKKLIAITTCLGSSVVYTVETLNMPNKNFDPPIVGKVIEKINASSYTYLKLKTKNDETWVAVPQLEINLNTEVELQKPIPMFGFESKTLKRKFDRLYFGVLKSQTRDIVTKNEKNNK